ncbi:MAG: hypothetical protein GY805_33850 [Chloroflexi bacterium]|nr:hypothetical protein [Chloroflexota bacterium]
MVSTIRQSGNVFLFFDADSRDQFTLPIPFESSNFGFAWADATHFSFWLSSTVNDLPYLVHYTLNTTTGELSIFEGEASVNNRLVSPGGRFRVHLEWTAWWDVEEGEQYGTESITIEAVDGTIIELEDPFAGEYDTSHPLTEWSVDGNFLSITHFHTADFENPSVQNSTTIFDNQGNLLATLDGVRGNWAKGGSGYFQYQDWQQGGLFCLVEVTTNQTECHKPVWRDVANSSTFSYQLSPGGSQLSFAYWRGANNLLYDGFDGGLCLMILETEEVTCPTDEYAEALLNEYGMSVLEGNWSPDGRFLQLLLDPGGPSSDDRTQSSLAIINADGSRFSWLGDIYWTDDPVWRPAEPSATPTSTPEPSPTVLTLTGPDFAFENIRFSLDPTIATTLYPTISEDGEQITFFFAEDGYCMIDGCISVTKVNLEKLWLTEKVPAVQTAVANQDSDYHFFNRSAALLLQTRLAYLSGTEILGVRAVTMHGQGLFFAHNDGIKYELRGLTPDGTYYVEMFIPLSLPFLPDDGAPNQKNQPHFAVPMPESLPAAYEELVPIINNHNDQVAAVLAETTVDTFTPNLAIIDQFIPSITIISGE